MSALQIARWTVRLAGVVMLALGALIWADIARSAIPIHMLVGVVLVFALWGEAVLALGAGASPALPVVAIAWGLLTLGFGMTQQGMTFADSRLPVEVAHLVVGLVAIGLGEALAGLGRRGRIATA